MGKGGSEVDVFAKGYLGAQMYIHLYDLIKPLRSILWRSRGLVEDADIVHAQILTQLRLVKYWDYLYGDHTGALFMYLAHPTKDSEMFESVAELQDAAKAYGDILMAKVDILEGWWKDPNNAYILDFTVDRRIIVGGTKTHGGSEITYLDPGQTDKQFIKPYVRALQFMLARTSGAIDMLHFINLEDFSKIFAQVSKDTMINAARVKARDAARGIFHGLSSRVRSAVGMVGLDKEVKIPAVGVSPKSIFGAMKNPEFSSFLTMRADKTKKEIENVIKGARTKFEDSARHELQFYVCGITFAFEGAPPAASWDPEESCLDFPNRAEMDTLHMPQSQAKEFIQNPNFMLVDWENKYHMYEERFDLYDSPQPYLLSSHITGRKIQINLDNIFKYRDDLKVFLPGAGDFDNKVELDRVEGKKKLNYAWGRPTNWNYKLLKEMFPDIQDNNPDSLYMVLRNLELTDSVVPFATFIPRTLIRHHSVILRALARRTSARVQ